jgi:hypothetical protein
MPDYRQHFVHLILHRFLERVNMSEELKWVMLVEIYGRLEAEMFKSYLESRNIPSELFQEGAGSSAYAVNVGPLSMVQIYVPKEKFDEAKDMLDAYENEQSGENLNEDEQNKDEKME